MARAYMLVAAAAMLAACSTSRYVPAGSYMLNRNVVEEDRGVPRSERITSDELDRFIRQSPARKFLGTNIPVAIYSAQDTARNGVLPRLLRGIGRPPVMLDSVQIERSAGNIRSYMRSRGYFDSKLWYGVETDRHKARVTYYVEQHEPYRIGNVSYTFNDEFIRPLVLRDTSATLVRPGDIFDINVLNAERSRITDDLKRQGFYDFNVNNISCLADSLSGGRTVDVTMVVRPHIEGYTTRGEPIYAHNAIYRIDSIFINPDYDPVAAASDPAYYTRMDTVEYRGLSILYRGKPKVREKVLRRAVTIYPNYMYDASQVQQTYANIIRMGYFRSASILFDNVTDSTNLGRVTYTGDDGDYDATTTEGHLRCVINCIPALRQSYKIDLEGSVSSNFFAVGATLGYQNRNLFRGAELWDITLSGRYEISRVRGYRGSWEIGGATSLSFPRFISPFRIDRYNRAMNPRTRFELSVNSQNRTLYERTLSGARLTYDWNNRRNSSFTLRPVDINIIKMGHVSDEFAEELEGNEYLKNSYSSQLLSGISALWVYNNQLSGSVERRNSTVLRLSAETAGNLLRTVVPLFSDRRTSGAGAAGTEEYYRIFGVRFAQYARFEGSLSRLLRTGPKTGISYRVLAGWGMSYGNSSAIPYDRLFYSGGANSMRGWIARRLGPGTRLLTEADERYPQQVGNLRLEANLEFRFPVWDFWHGAVFLDAGNVWYTGEGGRSDPEEIFHLRSFYKQVGLNTGVGVRLDLDRFIFRVDWGIRLHDPGKPAGSRWIDGLRFRDTAINFGVGYPF